MANESVLQAELLGEMGFCGCGCPEEALEHVRRTLEIFAKRAEANRSSLSREERDAHWQKMHRELVDHIGLESNPGMAWAYLYGIEDYIEHGTSAYAGWLNEDGEALLINLNAWAVEQSLIGDADG